MLGLWESSKAACMPYSQLPVNIPIAVCILEGHVRSGVQSSAMVYVHRWLHFHVHMMVGVAALAKAPTGFASCTHWWYNLANKQTNIHDFFTMFLQGSPTARCRIKTETGGKMLHPSLQSKHGKMSHQTKTVTWHT